MSTTVSGVVGPDGTIVSGVGFTADRIETGKYQISFTIPFDAVPAVTTTVVNEGSWALDNSVVWAIDQNHVQLITGNTKDEQADRGFSFIAIG